MFAVESELPIPTTSLETQAKWSDTEDYYHVYKKKAEDELEEKSKSAAAAQRLEAFVNQRIEDDGGLPSEISATIAA